MGSWWETILRCPICHASVAREGGSLCCGGARRHCFDFAGAGYVNLCTAKPSGGDDAGLIAARTAFLNEGYYAPIAARICELLSQYAPGKRVLDAGCGEGYYSAEMARNGWSLIGIDLSKRGILHAAKTAKREGLDAQFAVAGIFDLPVADASLDAVVSLFAPVCEAEFCRVLKPGGILLLAGAGADHLYSLKRVLYDQPYRNEERADVPQNMTLLTQTELSFVVDVPGKPLQDLFAMTPYYYRTPKEGVERLCATQQLPLDVDVTFSVYQK